MWQRGTHLQPRQRRHEVPQQPPPASLDGGQHLHLGGLTPAERAEMMRQLRGGQ